MNPPEGRRLELIHRPSGDPARVQHLGPYALESLIDPHEEGAATVYRVRIAPRERTRVSYHRLAEECYFVLAGRDVKGLVLALLQLPDLQCKPCPFVHETHDLRVECIYFLAQVVQSHSDKLSAGRAGEAGRSRASASKQTPNPQRR